jgi:hypothetical protein
MQLAWSIHALPELGAGNALIGGLTSIDISANIEIA